MTFFRYSADRLPYALFASYFALDVALFFTVDNLWAPPIIFVIGFFPKAFICAFNHHHQHLPTFYQPVLNRLAEIMFGFQTGIGPYAWYLHHSRGHHEHYLDQTKDESAWMRKDGSTMGEFEYTINVAATAYWRAYKRGDDLPKKQAAFVAMNSLMLALVVGAFVYNWYNALFMVLLPMVASLLITVWVTYYHHRGLDTGDHFSGSYNITTPLFNTLTGNLGYHTAHHYRPGVHWSKLPELHEKIKDKIPAHCYRDGAVLGGLVARRRAKKERERRRKERRRNPGVAAPVGARSDDSERLAA